MSQIVSEALLNGLYDAKLDRMPVLARPREEDLPGSSPRHS